MADFEEWARARSRGLARSAYLLTGDVHRAEDLVQETLIRVADRWPRLERNGSPDAYARRVLYHLGVDGWRRRRARPVEVAEDWGSDLAMQGADVEQRLLLRDALARLTPRQRAVLSLRFLEDLTEVQTAEVMGCSVSTVKSQTRHALRRVRELAPDLLASLAETGEMP